MYWLTPAKRRISVWECDDICMKFSPNGIRYEIFAWLGDDNRSCSCRLCPEDYIRGDKRDLLLNYMGCKNLKSMKRSDGDDFWPYFVAYDCKPAKATNDKPNN